MSEDGNARPTATDEGGVGDIVKAITADLQTIVRGEIELAKAELIPSAKNAGMGAGMFGGAGVLGLYGLGILFIGLSILIGSALQIMWLGFLIMAGGLFLIAAILVLIGKAQLKRADFSASRTKAATTATVTAVRGAVARVTTAAKTPAIERTRN